MSYFQDFADVSGWVDYFSAFDYSYFYRIFMTGGGVYTAWIFAHYVATHLYANYCTPWSLFGVFASPFLIASPHCQGLRWVIYEAGTRVGLMWGLMAGWVLGKIKTE